MEKERDIEIEQEIDEILKFGKSGANSGIETLTIIGQIEGHYMLPEGQKATKYEHLIPMLVNAEENPEIKGILIILNTMGGDVEAGLALSEMIASMSKPTVTLCLGGGHSIGVPLAVSGKRTFIVPSATMTLHPVRISGTVVGAPQTYTYFADMQKRIVGFICRHSNANEEQINSMMMRADMIATDVGTILEGHEAVECGLVDEIGGLDKALEALKEMIGE